MTTLGWLFAAAFLLGAVRGGRRGLLLATAVTVPFYDSAMLVVGQVGVQGWYVGLILYVAWSVLSKPRAEWVIARSAAPALLVVYSLVVTLVAPIAFEGLRVVAPGIGLDEQVGQLAVYTEFTESNFAQLGYLILNVLLVYLNEVDRVVGRKFLGVAFGVGTLAATAAYFLNGAWPQEIFDNIPGGFYAEPTDRIRNPLAEPSHLGGLAASTLPFFLVLALQERGARRIAPLVLAACGVLLLVESASGTAIIGGGVGALAFLALAALFARQSGNGVQPATIIIGLLATAAAIVIGPRVAAGIGGIVDSKLGSASLEARSFADANGFSLLEETNWVGIGLGTNRTSSLLSLLASNIGVIGTLLFAVVIWRCVRNGLADPARMPAAAALVVLLGASAFSLANLASPVMWALIAACWVRTYPTTEAEQSGEMSSGDSIDAVKGRHRRRHSVTS